nr:putative RNA-dependent RNA polymerase [Miltyush picorna-like virus 1]
MITYILAVFFYYFLFASLQLVRNFYSDSHSIFNLWNLLRKDDKGLKKHKCALLLDQIKYNNLMYLVNSPFYNSSLKIRTLIKSQQINLDDKFLGKYVYKWQLSNLYMYILGLIHPGLELWQNPIWEYDDIPCHCTWNVTEEILDFVFREDEKSNEFIVDFFENEYIPHVISNIMTHSNSEFLPSPKAQKVLQDFLIKIHSVHESKLCDYFYEVEYNGPDFSNFFNLYKIYKMLLVMAGVESNPGPFTLNGDTQRNSKSYGDKLRDNWTEEQKFKNKLKNKPQEIKDKLWSNKKKEKRRAAYERSFNKHIIKTRVDTEFVDYHYNLIENVEEALDFGNNNMIEYMTTALASLSPQLTRYLNIIVPNALIMYESNNWTTVCLAFYNILLAFCDKLTNGFALVVMTQIYLLLKMFKLIKKKFKTDLVTVVHHFGNTNVDISDPSSLIISSAISLFFIVVLAKIPGKNDFDSICNRIGKASTNVKGVEDLVGMYQEIFKKIKKVYNGENLAPLSQEFNDLVKEIMEFTQSSTWQEIHYDLHQIQRLEDLMKRSWSFVTTIQRVDSKLYKDYIIYHRTLIKIYEESLNSPNRGATFRKEPVVIRLIGNPGIGKTVLTWLMSISICGMMKIKDWKNAVYFRQHGKKYWQNFNAVQHRIVVFDEANQIKPDYQESIPFAGELIHLCNNAVCPLDVAECNLKAYAYFNADAIIMTDNVKDPRLDDVISCPRAYKRRLQLSLEPKIKPEFGKLSVNDNGQQFYMFDSSKNKSGNYLSEAYLFDIIDAENNKILESNLTYEEVEDKIHGLLNNHEDKHKKMTSSFEQFAETKMVKYHYNPLNYSWWYGPFAIVYSPFHFIVYLYRVYSYYRGYYRNSCMYNRISFATIEYTSCNAIRRFIAKHIFIFTESLFLALCVGAGYNYAKMYIKDKFKNFSIQKLEFWLRYNIRFAILLALPMVCYWFYKYFNKQETEVELSSESFEDKDHKTKQNPKQIAVKVKNETSIEGIANLLNKQGFPTKESSVAQMKEDPDFIPPEWVENYELMRKSRKKHPFSKQSFEEQTSKISKREKTTTVKIKTHNGEIDEENLETNFEFGPEGELVHQKQAFDSNTREVIDNKVVRNIYQCKIYLSNGHIITNNILFVAGKLAIIKTHAVDVFKDATKFEIYNLNNKFLIYPNEIETRVVYRDIKVGDKIIEERTDLAFMLIKANCVHAHRSLIKYFPTDDQFNDFKAAYGVMIGYANEGLLGPGFFRIRSGHLNMDPTVFKIKGGGYLTHMIFSDFYTDQGDCGSPWIIFDKTKPYYIVGIHLGLVGDKTAAQFVSQEIITMMMENLDYKITFHHAENNFNDPMEIEDKFEYNEIFETKFYPIGTLKNKIYMADKTKIRPSPIHGQVTEPVTKPAKLRCEPGLNVFKKNLSKYFVDHPRIDPLDILIFKAHIRNKIPKWNFRKLTMEEIVRGVGDLNVMNRKSAVGLPWSLKQTKRGKYEYLGKDEQFIYDHPDVLKRLQQYEDIVRQNQIPVIYVVDQVKDERRPIEKVDQGKTRFFGFAPFDFTIIVRKYLGAYLETLLEDKIDNSVLIGVDATSNDWSRVYTKLVKIGGKGENYIAGDHSNFDGMLNSEFLFAIFDVLVEQMVYEGEDREFVEKMIYSFALSIINAIHIFDQHVYQLANSQFSGNPLTTILNSLYNSGILKVSIHSALRKSYSETQDADIHKILKNLDKHYFDIVYGDDNCVAFDDIIKSVLNLNYMCDHMAKMGHIYTVDTKDSTDFVYRFIEDISILKRKFRFNSVLNYCYAPLSLDSVLEMLNWDKEEDLPQKLLQLEVNIDNVFRELLHHPKEIFTFWTDRIKKVLKENNIPLRTFYDYDYEQRNIAGFY